MEPITFLDVDGDPLHVSLLKPGGIWIHIPALVGDDPICCFNDPIEIRRMAAALLEAASYLENLTTKGA